MKRMHFRVVAYLMTMIGALTFWMMPSTSAQQEPCPDPMRRSVAVRLARVINTAQAQMRVTNKPHQPLSALTNVTIPAGFSVQLVATDTEYVFSVKDSQNACGFTVFSDHEGVIYTAQPLQ